MTTTRHTIGTAEAANILDVNRRTVGRWVESGRLTPILKADGLRGPAFFRRSTVEKLAAELDEKRATNRRRSA